MINDEIYFCKYPKKYLKDYNEIFLIVYVYLHRFKSIEGYVNLTIKDLLLYYNFKPNAHKNKINDKIYTILQQMIDMQFISFVGCCSNSDIVSISEIKCDKQFTVQIINFDDKWDTDKDFVKIEYQEIDKLRKNINGNLDKVLILYLNIKKRISATDDISAIKISYPSEDTLSRECDFSNRSIKTYVKLLCDCQMLYMRNFGAYKAMKKGKEVITNSNNVYALEEKYLDNAKEEFKQYLITNAGFIAGFFPLCNNLPSNTSNDVEDNDIVSSSEQEQNITSTDTNDELMSINIVETELKKKSYNDNFDDIWDLY